MIINHYSYLMKRYMSRYLKIKEAPKKKEVTERQIWLTANASKVRVQLPVLPESISFQKSNKNNTFMLAESGEVATIGGEGLTKISFSSFFPATRFQGVKTKKFLSPKELVEKIERMQHDKAPIKLTITGLNISMYVMIDSFKKTEKGGDVGTIYYSLSLKEYKKAKIRKMEMKKKKAVVVKKTDRVDTKATGKTYTVVKGDCLYLIGKRYGMNWKKIYNANRNVVGANPNIIYPGQKLIIPS